MSLTVAQANAVNRLAEFLLSFDVGDDSHAQALTDLGTLVADAHKRLAAGYSPTSYTAAVDAWDAS